MLLFFRSVKPANMSDLISYYQISLWGSEVTSGQNRSFDLSGERGEAPNGKFEWNEEAELLKAPDPPFQVRPRAIATAGGSSFAI